MGAYVSLLEYNNLDGMILASELSRRRIRSMNKVIRVGKSEVVVVLRVDKEKGYIDLSKRRVTEEDIAACEEKFNKSMQVHSMLSRVAKTCNTELIKLYKQFGWAMYKKYGHAYDAFKKVVSGDEALLDEFEMSDDVKKALLHNIKRRLTPQPHSIRATVEVTCFGYQGIDAIKEALFAGQEVVPEKKDELKIRLLAPPLYTISTVSVDEKAGVALVEKAIARIAEVLKPLDGHVVVKSAARVTSESDDQKLKEDLQAVGKENQQVAGDEPDEDE